MRNINRAILSLLILFILAISCSERSKSSKKIINPNGDSELALLMREMFDDMEELKSRIENEQPISSLLGHENILTAHATQPEKAASAEYQAFAKTYLNTVEALRKAEPEKAKGLYDVLVLNCEACHKELCPGPLVRIEKLK